MSPSRAPGARPAAVWAALATIYLVWGSTYLGIMVAIRTLPPLLMSGVRFLLAGALLYAWASRGDRRPSAREWRTAAIAGAALLLVGNGGVAVSEQWIDSGIAALLIATIPLWMALLDRLFFGSRLAPGAVLGLVAGLGGVALLVGPAGGAGIDPAGAVICLLAALGWAAGSLYTRGASLAERALLGAGMQMLAGGALLVVAGVATGELASVDLGAVSGESLLAVAYLVVFGSLVAFTAYTWLLQSAPTALVSTYAYVNPVVAVALGAVFLSEPVTARTALAGLAIVASVALIVTSRMRPAEPRPAAAEVAEEGATLAA